MGGKEMLMRRFLNGKEVETVGGLDAIVLLVANEYGEQASIIEGDDEAVKRIVIEGVIHWPSVIPYEEEMQRAIRRELWLAPFLPHEVRAARTSEVNAGSDILQKAFADETPPQSDRDGIEDLTIHDDGIGPRIETRDYGKFPHLSFFGSEPERFCTVRAEQALKSSFSRSTALKRSGVLTCASASKI